MHAFINVFCATFHKQSIYNMLVKESRIDNAWFIERLSQYNIRCEQIYGINCRVAIHL